MTIQSILQQLGLDEQEAKVYLGLLERGPLSASKLAQQLLLRRTSLYGLLKRLRGVGLVMETQRDGVKVFLASPPEEVQRLISERLELLDRQQRELTALLPALKRQMPTTTLTPRFRLFEGVEEVRQAMRDVLLYRDLATEAFWPQRDMVAVLGSEFLWYHNQVRIRQHVSIRAIWPVSKLVTIKDYPFLGDGQPFRREIRVAPKGIECSLGYWIYGDRVMFISSRQESFAFTIESRELAQTLRTQFEFLWKSSKRLKISPKDVEPFLRELA